jgi:predicted AAA+ superfamily ATPase
VRNRGQKRNPQARASPNKVPWREVAIPHSDVLKGTFQQAEFAADISAVGSGKAPDIYKDAALFFDHTFITEGMALLLTQVAQRRANGTRATPQE